jgi:hypothetical protein
MTVRVVLRRASIGIHFGHFNNVLLDMLAADVLQMTMIEIINMILMPNSGVATVWAMSVRTCTGSLVSRGHWGAFPLAASRAWRKRSCSEQSSGITIG